VAGNEPPVGELETTLAEIWCKVLQLDQVGRRDNFFELGGHSLLAVRVVSLMEQTGLDVVVGDLFTYPTIAALAGKIGELDKQPVGDMPTCLKEGGVENPLFLVHPSIFGYYARVLAPHVADSIPVYSVPPKALREDPDRTIEGMAMRMVQMIRAVQPHGPYRIAGYSNGGPLAYEIAAQLLGADQRIDFLGLIDAYYRGGGSHDTSTVPAEVDTKETLLGILKDTCARPDKYVRRVTREDLDELTQRARTMDTAAFLRMCQDRLVLPIRYDNLTLAQLEQSFAHDRANELADLQYCAQPLPIAVHFFLARERQESSVDSWKSVVPPQQLRIIPIEGNHQSIMDKPNVAGFGQTLSDAILHAAKESEEQREGSFPPLIGLQSGRANTNPHFWIPGAGASMTSFAQLVACLDRTMPVYGLQPRGLDGDLVPHSSVRAAAEFNLAAISQIYPSGPVHLLGHSFGGWVAFEMAQLLLESGRTVASLTILDKEAPDETDNVSREYTNTDILMDLIDGFELTLGRPLGIGRIDIESLTETAQRELLHRRLVASNLMPRRTEPDVLRGPLRTFGASIRAHYKPDKPYPGRLTLILVDDPRLDQASNRRYRDETTENWKRCAPNLVCVHGPGNHLTMLKEPHVQALAVLIRASW
jgi:arthrofactin-type cyclic lipopeptide synthetase C